tara:strand:- start:161 stop:622 length:462 start_codon:yes stop_codon:yes gene_type:complete
MEMTGRQRQFSELIASGEHNATEAYRLSYSPNENTSKKSISERASRLLKNTKVIAMIEDIQRDSRDQLSYDRIDYLRDLQSLAEDSKTSGNYSASVSAMSLIGKCLGFNAPIETIHTNTIQVMASLSVDQLQRLVEISDNPMIINGSTTSIND